MMPLVSATKEDARFVYDLRFNDQNRHLCWTMTFPSFQEHEQYFLKHLHEYKIIMKADKKIGFLRLGKEIGIFLLKEYQGRGIGSIVLSQVSGRTSIKKENTMSQRAFENAGWKQTGYIYEKKEEEIEQ